jgi:hypothetical protein
MQPPGQVSRDAGRRARAVLLVGREGAIITMPVSSRSAALLYKPSKLGDLTVCLYLIGTCLIWNAASTSESIQQFHASPFGWSAVSPSNPQLIMSLPH